MEEYLWLIFISIALILRGLNSYFIKYISYHKILSTHFFIISQVFAVITFLFFVDFSTLFNLEIIAYGFIVGFLVYLNLKLLLSILNHLSTSFVFVNTRVLTTIGIFLLGSLFFQEQITYLQLFGVFFGIMVFLLLYDKNDTVNSSAVFSYGVKLFAIYIISMILVNSINKVASGVDLFNYGFYFVLFPLIFFVIEAYFKKIEMKEFINFSDKNYFRLIIVGIINGIAISVNNIFYFKALALKEFIIVYKMYSFEIFVPIILSYLFLDEELNFRKIFALFLTVLSIIFLI